jgi:meiotically up-regulated gene 157 (Mug157) protein
MYAAGALRRLLALNTAGWGSAEVERRAGQLLQDIRQGLDKWGTTTAPDGSKVYAYEVRRLIFGIRSSCSPEVIAAGIGLLRMTSACWQQGACRQLSSCWLQRSYLQGNGCRHVAVEGLPVTHHSKNAPPATLGCR